MKKWITVLLCAVLLTGCGEKKIEESPQLQMPQRQEVVERSPVETIAAPEYASSYAPVREILISDEGITVDGGSETEGVYTSRDIIYYEDKDSYDSGNPYGEGESWQRHTAEEAEKHMVVNITEPGAYRVSGKLTAGQIRVDLGEDAYDDPGAVVELILSDADITCSVAPVILFLNTYECDGDWSVETAKPEVDTVSAGANLILEGHNTLSGSHVARIYKDKEGEKKLWKQDGAVYSYMSMNVFGPGSLDLTADNEGLDTELHLTINGGTIRIYAGNDGINTNEDGVSVTTINGGTLQILAGLDEEGDGIDSNGYLVINGGTVVASAHPAADAGMDSDLGSFIHGGTVIALGSTMDWAESESRQITMNLQFAEQQAGGSAIAVTGQDGMVVFAFDPEWDSLYDRAFSGAILSGPWLTRGDTCSVSLGGTVSGTGVIGLLDPALGIACEGGVVQQFTGTDVGMGGFPGGFPGEFGGQRPDEFGEAPPEMPEGGRNPGIPQGEVPDKPQGDMSGMPERMEDPGNRGPHGSMSRPEGFRGDHDQNVPQGAGRMDFYLQDMVNNFSGIHSVTE